MSAQVFDPRKCQLGEGLLWHPERQQMFWFDILGKRLLSQRNGNQLEWQFDEHVSAAGWVDDRTLLIASETGLYTFDLETGQRSLIKALEADNPETRSNDGRADPWGGFWIGTMGKDAKLAAGAIYRFYRGEIQQIYAAITISNSICFSPDRNWAYYTDTADKKIMRQKLSSIDGWPDGPPELFINLEKAGLFPDGSVIDANGCLWNAQWGASRVAQYSPKGVFLTSVPFPAAQISCPAFGGDDLTVLFATSAAAGDNALLAGQTFSIDVGTKGQNEHQVIL